MARKDRARARSAASSKCCCRQRGLARRHPRARRSLPHPCRAQRLAADVHPLFATRGVPGTHAVALAFAIIEEVLAGRAFETPRFEKAFDDRAATSQRVTGPVDVLLFEGWCVGAAPQEPDKLSPRQRAGGGGGSAMACGARSSTLAGRGLCQAVRAARHAGDAQGGQLRCRARQPPLAGGKAGANAQPDGHRACWTRVRWPASSRITSG